MEDTILNGKTFCGVCSQKVVALTGAGISVASGISPFEDRGGLWEKYDRRKLPILKISGEIPIWVMLKRGSGGGGEGTAQFRAFIPGQDEKGLSAVYSSIDGFTRKRATKRDQYHGNTTRLVCLSCSALFSYREMNLGSLLLIALHAVEY